MGSALVAEVAASPEAEAGGDDLGDFMALLDEKEREVVVSGGYTELTGIPAEVRYATNHSLALK